MMPQQILDQLDRMATRDVARVIAGDDFETAVNQGVRRKRIDQA